MICKHCGANLTPEDKMCSYCRCAVDIEPPPMQMQQFQQQQLRAMPGNYQRMMPGAPAVPRHKTSALVLCLLGFLGLGGLHRFYSGKIGTGLLWLCTGGLFGIGTFVDLLLILLNSFNDKDGNPLQ